MEKLVDLLKIRELKPGNYMVRVFIEHTKKGTTAYVYTKDRTIEVHINDDNTITANDGGARPSILSGAA
jgi:phosphatidate phosphatase PAH1